MENLHVININENEKWDSIVKGFRNYDVYYFSSYCKAFQLHGDGEPLLIYFEGQSLRGINVVMKRDIANESVFSGKLSGNTYFDISTPYGYGGWLIEGNGNSLLLNAEYIDWCDKHNIISEFVRFHPIIDNVEAASSIYCVSEVGQTITMKLNSYSEIWNDLASKNRNMIRKAMKNGVKIYRGRNPELLDEFIKMYNATMDRDDAKEYYYFAKVFFNSVLEDLKYNSLLFYAVYEHRIIAMSIILFSNGKMHYHLSASLKDFRHLAPTNLLLYEVACWGCENGYKSFHLGGGIGCQEDSLFKFKKSFNTNNRTSFWVGKKIFNQKIYNQLVELRDKNNSNKKNEGYFPEYRG